MIEPAEFTLKDAYDMYAVGMSFRPLHYAAETAWSSGAASLPPRLCYYTTGPTLLSIIEKHAIWSTQVSCVNDSKEIRYAASVFRDACQERSRREGAAEEEAILYRELERRLVDEPAVKSRTYIACFSEQENDLSQWRAYSGGPAGENGYCIEFDPAGLAEMFRAPGRSVRLVKVEYGKAEHRRWMERIADLLFSSFMSIYRYASTTVPLSTWAKDYVTIWASTLGEVAPQLKHPDFKNEAEWRLVVSLVEENPSELVFQQRSAMISRHLPLRREPLPIRRVLVGPARHKEVAAESLRLALRKHGYTAEVDVSDTPLQAP